MVDFETTQTQRENTGMDEQGAVVREKTNSIQTKAGTKTTAVNFIWYIYGLMAILLSIRMILKLFGANSANGFVDLIYSVSGVLSAPFDSIFGVTEASAGATRSVFEPSIIVAIAVYALIAWGMARLLTLNDKN